MKVATAEIERERGILHEDSDQDEEMMTLSKPQSQIRNNDTAYHGVSENPPAAYDYPPPGGPPPQQHY